MKINQIYIYPIKSLRGVSVQSATATRTGFTYDRRFMLLKVIQNDDGIETLKNMHVPHFPEMALFQTQILPSSDRESAEKGQAVVRVSWRPSTDTTSTTTTASGASSVEGGEEEKTLDIPLTPDTRGLEELGIVMHSSPTKGFNMGKRYNEWFSGCLGYPVVLAYLGEANWRRVLGSFPPGRSAVHREAWYAPLLAGSGSGWVVVLAGLVLGLAGGFWQGGLLWAVVLGVGLACAGFLSSSSRGGRVIKRKEERITFADASPFMVVSQASVANVSDRLEGDEEMDPTKFRANVVIQGAETAFEEDFWAELDILGRPEEEKAKLLLTANCVRCRSLDVDYATGKMGTGESGKVLKKLMTDRRVDRGAKYNPVFGRYGFLDGRVTSREIRVGDEVVVARRMKERSVYDWPGLA